MAKRAYFLRSGGWPDRLMLAESEKTMEKEERLGFFSAQLSSERTRMIPERENKQKKKKSDVGLLINGVV